MLSLGSRVHVNSGAGQWLRGGSGARGAAGVPAVLRGSQGPCSACPGAACGGDTGRAGLEPNQRHGGSARVCVAVLGLMVGGRARRAQV